MTGAEIVSIDLDVDADPKRALPKGRITLAVLATGRRAPSVQAIYVAIPARGKSAARTASFDDGVVAVDYDAKGRVRGVELLALKNTDELREFFRAARASRERRVLFAAVATAMTVWDQFEVGMALAIQGAPDDARIAPRRVQVALRKRASTRRWRSLALSA